MNVLEPVFLHDWGGADEVFADFENYQSWTGKTLYPIADKDDIEILLASYTYKDYSGNAFVLFRRKSDGYLYEVNGDHCSCNGLEGQWAPEDTNIAVLRHRIENGRLGREWDGQDRFATELTAVLDELEAA